MISNAQIWAFWAKKYQIFELNEILHVPYFKDTDFKCNIDFQKFWVKIPKIGHFGPKSINFLILTKFCMYSISTVLISNMLFVLKDFELKSPNLGILGQEALTLILTKIRMCPILKVLLSNLTLVLKGEILFRCWFYVCFLISIMILSWRMFQLMGFFSERPGLSSKQ